MTGKLGKGNIKDLIDQGKCLIDKHEIVFFDVFNTLICRDCKNPSDVFEFVEKHLCMLKEAPTEFRKKRMSAETECRNSVACPSLENIYRYLKAPNKDYLMKTEIEAEFALCVKKYIGYELYRYAKDRRKTIAAVTDMYLSSETIRKLLRHNGYEITDVFVSCEVGEEKYKGGLFNKVIDILSVSKKDVVHFGDSLVSDGMGAIIAGIDFMLIPENPKLRYTNILRNNGGYLSTFIRNRVPFIDSPLEALGYEIGGPVIVGFCQWLHKKLHEGNYRKALFCSRDMYQTLEVYKLMYPDDSKIVEYFYVSRKSLEIPYEAALGKNVSEYAVNQVALLKDYLKQIGGNGKIALVDSGMHGSSQKMLSEITKGDCEIHGFYMRISKFFRENIQDQESEAYFNDGNPKTKHFISAQFFESLIAAPHGRTLSWEKNKKTGIVEPILGPGNNSKIISEFQKGISIFCTDFAKSSLGKIQIDGNYVSNPFLKLSFYPENSDVNLLRCVQCGDDVYTSIFQSKEMSIGFFEGLKQSCWKGGYLCDCFPHMYKPVSYIYQFLDIIILTAFNSLAKHRL